MTATNLTDRPVRSDSLEYLGVGLHLAATGEYRFDDNSPGYHTREPGMPVLIAIATLAKQGFGFEPVSRDCLNNETAGTEACRSAYLPLKLVQILCLLGGVIFVVLLLREINAPTVFQVVVATLIFLDARLLFEANRFTTEILAGMLMAATSLFAVRTARERSMGYAIATGIALACLVLTKVAFAYLWIFLALCWCFLLRREGLNWMQISKYVVVFVIVHSTIVGAYMVRNYTASGQFEIVENRSYTVLSVRAAYNTMTTSEFWHGFGLYTPGIGIDGFRENGVPAEAFARLVNSYSGSFRQQSMAWVDRRLEGLNGKVKEKEISLIRAEALQRLNSDPIAHLRVTLLLAYRSVFTSQGWGYGGTDGVTTISSKLGLNVPRFGVPLSPWLRTILDLMLFTSLLGAALLSLVRKEYSWLLVIVLPALYAHGVYAFATHFLPRYALPELFIRWVALTSLSLVLYRIWRDARSTQAS